MANRKRQQSGFRPGIIFGLAMTAAGLALLAIGFGLFSPFGA